MNILANKYAHIYLVNYFMLFIIFGHLFVLNMFVGVVVGCFIQEKEDLELNHLLTPW